MKCDRFSGVAMVTSGCIVTMAIISLCFDITFISPHKIISIFFGHIDDKTYRIIMLIRLPRISLAVSCGAALACAGALMQTVLANDLASPYTLGLSSAASFGVALTYVLNLSFFNGIWAIRGNAFLCSFISLLMLYMILIRSKSNRSSIVLGGIAINFLFSSLTSILKYFASAEVNYQYEFWTMGSLSAANMQNSFFILFVTIFAFIVMFPFLNDSGRILNNEKDAVLLGVPVKFIRLFYLTVSSILTAIVVSTIGIIGFVGLVAPHISRLLKFSKPRQLVPLSMLIGALVLLVADFISRKILQPQILPIGAISSLFGIPFFIFLIFRNKKNV